MAPPGVEKPPTVSASSEGPPKVEEQSELVKGKITDKAPSSMKNKDEKPKGGAKETELSGAQLKKRAKEEKAARRAKVQQEKQAPSQSVIPSQSRHGPSMQTESGNKIASGQAIPKQQKRRGSATANAQQQLPIRTPEHQTATASPIPKRDSTIVSLFSHLYGQPRRTSMTGAGKDIHAAVVTLGLKMSHYIICGSNARCVAMLLAFKKVRPCIESMFIC